MEKKDFLCLLCVLKGHSTDLTDDAQFTGYWGGLKTFFCGFGGNSLKFKKVNMILAEVPFN